MKKLCGLLVAGMLTGCSLFLPSHGKMVSDPLECEPPNSNVREITYRLDSNFTSSEEIWIKRAMSIWDSGTKRLKFVKTDRNDPDLLFVRDKTSVETDEKGSPKYCSLLGEYHFATHTIVIFSDCIQTVNYFVSTVVHEIGHSLIVNHYSGSAESYMKSGINRAPDATALPLRDRLEFCKYQDCRCL